MSENSPSYINPAFETEDYASVKDKDTTTVSEGSKTFQDSETDRPAHINAEIVITNSLEATLANTIEGSTNNVENSNKATEDSNENVGNSNYDNGSLNTDNDNIVNGTPRSGAFVTLNGVVQDGGTDEINLTEENVDQSHAAGAENWRIPIENFTVAQGNTNELRQRNGMKRNVKRYYKQQEALIEEFTGLVYDNPDRCPDAREEQGLRTERIASICAKVTFSANLLLFIGKIVASVLSGSLSIISSLVDSAVDLVSGIVLWLTSSAMKKRDIYKYPGGKKRMEPLAILILSVIMSMASAMVIITAIQQIQTYATTESAGPTVDLPTIILIVITIVTKLVLFLVMRRYEILSVEALSQDHRNDVVSNIMALIMGFVGSKYWPFADPIGAIVIAFYILGSWCVMAFEQVQMLAGKTADPDFLKKITWIAINHHPAIIQIETVTVFHFGQQFLAEVHIVLPEEMRVKEAHDIQESLQQRLEQLEEVERAFVHIDHDTQHKREDEHKFV